MKKKVGIVGGSGFVASSIANYFVKDFQVKVIDIKQPPEEIRNEVEYVQCDIRDYEQVRRSLEDIDLVIQTAIIQIPLINEKRELGYEVNILGTQNTCKAVKENSQTKGMILAGSWHIMGEGGIKDTVNEEFGSRPDKVEDRARLYVLSKIVQETIVRFFDEMSDKVYGVIRMGTVLGEKMPKETAANLFIEKGLKGEAITPYKHSMYRPMLYVDVGDVCKGFWVYAKKIVGNQIEKSNNSLAHVVNLYYDKPVTIIELAELVRDSIIKLSSGKIRPQVEIVDKGLPPLFSRDSKSEMKIDVSKARELLDIDRLRSPEDSLNSIIKGRLSGA